MSQRLDPLEPKHAHSPGLLCAIEIQIIAGRPAGACLAIPAHSEKDPTTGPGAALCPGYLPRLNIDRPALSALVFNPDFDPAIAAIEVWAPAAHSAILDALPIPPGQVSLEVSSQVAVDHAFHSGGSRQSVLQKCSQAGPSGQP
jgi:hypothetical protein